VLALSNSSSAVSVASQIWIADWGVIILSKKKILALVLTVLVKTEFYADFPWALQE